MSNTDVILDEKQIAEIEARHEAATEGPWLFGDYGAEMYAPNAGNKIIGLFGDAEDYTEDPHDDDYDNGIFVAHARADVPALCQTVRALRQENESLEADNKMLEGVVIERDDLQHKLTSALRMTQALQDGRALIESEKRQYADRLAQVEQEMKDAEARYFEQSESNTIIMVGAGDAIDDFRTRAIQLCRDKAAEWERLANAAPIGAFENERFPYLKMRDAANEIREGLEKLT